MWLWPVGEMAELAPEVSAPRFGGESSIRIRQREMTLPNRASLRPGLLWLTLNLALIIQCLSRNNRFSTLHTNCSTTDDFVCSREYRRYPTLRSPLSTFSNRGYERMGLSRHCVKHTSWLASGWVQCGSVYRRKPISSGRAWRAQETPPLASMEPFCEGQTCLRVCALSYIELQAARVSAE
jgi:hypothetical protein